jgi:invasion protein IalB
MGIAYILVAAIACGATVAVTAAARAQTAKPAPRPPAAEAPAAPQPAPVGAEPQSTTATFGDWVLRCVRGTAPDQLQRLCEVAQTLEVKGQGVVAEIALGRVAPKEPMRMTIVLPTNVSLLSGVHVGLSDKDENAIELGWKRCLPGGCLAEADVRDDLLRSWRAQTGAGQIHYVLASAQPLNLSFSFRGLAVALDNLAKGAAAQ